ncbi:DUF1360 domain-containing protein [Archangium lansingense]|uniref:DUF1360 domain-containing protein n=1 Tax=Archangium lansingense TaxID=2995310 RepID=A0ABT3ZW76_9BACT|nr:DUF1360 domain-containing protein [Archangium lansinium]MCY1073621.1 DUF1360 domain-containing protein [Archangium lansinium]
MLVPLQERRFFAGYRDEQMPLGSYALLMGFYGTALAGFLRWRDGRALPARLTLRDTLLLGVATHKLSRILARDFVTSPLRAPFVRYEGKSPAAEVSESSRGHGLRRAIGDLVSCTFCLGPWVAGALVCAHAVRPRETRLVASIFALTTVSDFLHRSYEWVGEGLKRTRRLAKAVVESEGPAHAPPPQHSPPPWVTVP